MITVRATYDGKVFRPIGPLKCRKGAQAIVVLDGGTSAPRNKKIPNKTTAEAMRDADEGRNLIKCKNVADMFKKLHM